MKHLRFLAALCCMLAVFTACEKNEPSDNGNGSNTGNYNANGHEYVDLGLPSGTKWATCNVGATKPEEHGNEYAWGETEPKTTCDWSTYKYGSDYDELTKYCTDSDDGKDGFADYKTVLDPEDDAAHVNWGGAWRMPTDEEWTELRENCAWKWTDDYNGTGTVGQIVTGLNGNSIFLPAPPYHFSSGGVLVGCSTYGVYYWSSSLDADRPDGAWGVLFTSDCVYRDDFFRFDVCPVRPVLGE